MVSYRRPKLGRLCAIAALLGIVMAGCVQPPPPPPAPAPVVEAAPPPPPPEPPPPNALNKDRANYLRLPNLAGGTPVRVGVILPLSSSNAGTRALAQSMLKAAQLALFDAGNADIVLIADDEGNGGPQAAAAANRLLAAGAEVILGPLFGPSVAAIAPIARDRGVPVLAFSTERNVAGRGVYLISYLPENEVSRVVAYASAKGHKNFAALVPRTAYGDLAASAMKSAVEQAGGKTVEVDTFTPNPAAVLDPSIKAAKSGADALLIAQGGAVLRAIAPVLATNGADRAHMQLLGTGLWDDSLSSETALQGGLYAAPAPNADDNFDAKYRAAFGTAPANLASLAYDAMALVALLAPGEPYHRFTREALMDPNGFTGVSGTFRFRADGTSERGLAVLEVGPEGAVVVDPAPATFQRRGP